MNPVNPPASGPLARQKRWLDDYRFGLRVGQLGTVSAVGDGIDSRSQGELGKAIQPFNLFGIYPLKGIEFITFTGKSGQV